MMMMVMMVMILILSLPGLHTPDLHVVDSGDHRQLLGLDQEDTSDLELLLLLLLQSLDRK